MENEKVSECCSARPLGEIIDGFARCSCCKEMAEFISLDAITNNP